MVAEVPLSGLAFERCTRPTATKRDINACPFPSRRPCSDDWPFPSKTSAAASSARWLTGTTVLLSPRRRDTRRTRLESTRDRRGTRSAPRVPRSPRASTRPRRRSVEESSLPGPAVTGQGAPCPPPRRYCWPHRPAADTRSWTCAAAEHVSTRSPRSHRARPPSQRFFRRRAW